MERGDLVKLKSGGPVMTVGTFRTGNVVICQWFDDTNILHTEEFNQAALEKFEKQK